MSIMKEKLPMEKSLSKGKLVIAESRFAADGHSVKKEDFTEERHSTEEGHSTEKRHSEGKEYPVKKGKKEKSGQKKPQGQPYERFLRFGAENLTEAELLAIIIRTGTREKSALQLAEQVLSLARYPKEGLLGLYEVTLDELQSISGIGEVKAVKLKCLTELSMRMSAARAAEGINFTSSGQVAAYFMEKLRHRDTECVILVCLDAKGQMICERRISEGSVNMSLISPREIFLAALEKRAVNIILVHNHPSGDPNPSSADKELTRHVRESGEQMGIPLLDHIVIGDNRYVSFKEADWFREA